MWWQVGNTVLEILVKRVNRNEGFRERLVALEGKAFAFRIGKQKLLYKFYIEHGTLKGPLKESPEPDFILEGSWRVLWQIARRKLDPDAAFFKRKLSIRGCPQNALILKNIYDNL